MVDTVVLVDLDGTLVDHRSAVWEAIGPIVRAAPNAACPAQAANVGDMLESDVNAAAVAGLTGIWLDRGVDFITGGSSPIADETVLRVERLTDLPAHLSPTGA